MVPAHKRSATKFFCLIAVVFTLAGCATPAANEYLDWSAEDYIQVLKGVLAEGVGGEETLQRIYTMPGSTADDWTITLDVECLPILDPEFQVQYVDYGGIAKALMHVFTRSLVSKQSALVAANDFHKTQLELYGQELLSQGVPIDMRIFLSEEEAVAWIKNAEA